MDEVQREESGLDPILRLDTSSLAALLRQAIGDMDERISTGLYRPRGDTWHSPEHVGYDGRGKPFAKCEICLAGATFARWGWTASEDVIEANLPVTVKPAMKAIDCLRHLQVIKAYAHLHDRSGEKLSLSPTRVLRNACEDMRALADQYPQHESELHPQRLKDWEGQDRDFYLKVADILEKHGL